MNREEHIKLLMTQTNTNTEQELQELLKKRYYETNEPIIDDMTYDNLFGDKDYVGYTPEKNGPWDVLEHKIPMGSLEKIKTWDDAIKWVNNKSVVWQPKLDGLSMELIYTQGKLSHAILRGGGDKGEDILKNAAKFEGSIPEIRETSFNVSVRGEVVISSTNFEKLNRDSQGLYSNRRNCISGICRRYDGKYSEYLSFYTYDIIFYDNNNNIIARYNTYIDKIKELYELGFKIPFTLKDMNEAQYNSYAEIRNSAEQFQMDGLVIKSLENNDMIALKFPPNGEQTTVTGYTWEVGTTGKLVPVIYFEKVNIGGSNLTKASVGSYKIYKELNAPIGSIVEVRKMNDVIPKVVRTVQASENSLETPDVCPICGTKLELKGTDLYCVNNNCPVKIEQSCTAVYDVIAIKGIKSGWIKDLIKQGKIKEPADVLKITNDDIANLDGYSLKTAEKITSNFAEQINTIFANNDKYLKTFLKMIAIPGLGDKAYDKFANIFTDMNDIIVWIQQLSEENKSQLKTALGNSAGEKSYDYIINHKSEILNLINAMKELLN